MLNKRQKNQRFISYTFLEKNRKAQVSDIMTWVVATIIILSILLLFVYASSLLAQKTKIIKAKDLKIDFEKEVDLLETKNLIASDLASENEGQIIRNWEEDKENE